MRSIGRERCSFTAGVVHLCRKCGRFWASYIRGPSVPFHKWSFFVIWREPVGHFLLFWSVSFALASRSSGGGGGRWCESYTSGRGLHENFTWSHCQSSSPPVNSVGMSNSSHTNCVKLPWRLQYSSCGTIPTGDSAQLQSLQKNKTKLKPFCLSSFYK